MIEAGDQFNSGGHMNTKPVIPKTGTTTEDRQKVSAGIAARIGQIVIGFIFEAIVLFLSAGRLNWVWAWVFLGIYLLSVSINSAFMFRTSPETIAERGKPGEMKDWDKVVSGLWSLFQFFLLPLVAGLDVRFGWTQGLSIAWHTAGIVMFAAGLGFFGWAMITNAYFSTAVRIQSERGQTVCRSGPYRFMRHPGYVGTILQSLGIPFLLGSWWTLIAGVAASALIIFRTAFEDRTLQTELPGYQDFAREVRYRLVPGIW
jgi:protein-S-isoprenylcysteine O-methyltransferase Ste14